MYNDDTYRPGRKSLPNSFEKGDSESRSEAASSPQRVVGEPTQHNREGDCDLSPHGSAGEFFDPGTHVVPIITTQEENETEHTRIRLRKGSRLFAMAGWTVAALLFGYVLIKLVFLANEALSLSPVFRILALAGIAIVISALIIAVVGFVSVCRKLPKFDQVDKWNDANENEAKKRLKIYVNKICSPTLYVEMSGLDEEVVVRLKDLQKDSRYGNDPDQWLAAFRCFYEKQNAKADDCIKNRARLVALKTAVSPWKSLDMAVVLFHAVVLMRELAVIYNRKVSGVQAFRLVIGAVIALTVSGTAQDLTEAAAESLGSILGGSVVGKMLGAKVAEGSVNWYFFKKLGNAGKKYLSPISFDYLNS